MIDFAIVEALEVHVPLQIGVVFNNMETIPENLRVLVPLQIGVVFNYPNAESLEELSSRPLTNRGSL